MKWKKKVKKRRKGKRKYEKRYQMNSSINFFHIHPHLYLSSVLMKYRKSRERECLRWFIWVISCDICVLLWFGLVWFNWFHVWCVQKSFGFLIFFPFERRGNFNSDIFWSKWYCSFVYGLILSCLMFSTLCIFFFSFLLHLDITWFLPELVSYFYY